MLVLLFGETKMPYPLTAGPTKTYDYGATIDNSTPVVITSSTDGVSNLGKVKFHSIQCTGDACVVDVKIGNNSVYTNVDTLDDAIKNLNSHGVTAIRLTVASGTCAVSISGTSE